MYGPGRTKQFLTPMQVRGHAVNAYVGNEVIFVGIVTRRPSQTRGYGFRPRLQAHFHFPLYPIRVAHNELRISSIQILLHKGEGAVRFVLPASRPIEQVAGRRIRWVGPE